MDFNNKFYLVQSISFQHVTSIKLLRYITSFFSQTSFKEPCEIDSFSHLHLHQLHFSSHMYWTEWASAMRLKCRSRFTVMG